MIIECPHCQARLNLPEHVEGKQVRCQICRHVFWADQEAPKESVQAGSPESASVRREPSHEEQGRFEDQEDCDESIHYRDSRELIERAKSLARPAGYAMLIAFIFTTINIFGDAAIYMATDNLGMAKGAEGAVVTAATSVCHILLYAPMLAFVGLGARSLFTLGSRGLIVTAIVMSIFVLLLLGGGSVISSLFLPAPDLPAGTAVAMCCISSLANLTAAVMAMRVLASDEVADAYAARAKEQRWRR